MSEPTRLKAVAAGAFVGAPLTLAGGILGAVLEARPGFVSAEIAVPIAALLGLIVGALPFSSSRNRPISYAIGTVVTAAAGAAAIMGASDAFSLRTLN